jgi:hypothetical protein
MHLLIIIIHIRFLCTPSPGLFALVPLFKKDFGVFTRSSKVRTVRMRERERERERAIQDVCVGASDPVLAGMMARGQGDGPAGLGGGPSRRLVSDALDRFGG